MCLVRALAMALVAAAAAAALTPTAGAAPPSPAQQLVRAYSPIVMLREQTDVCDDTEEQYEPTTVYVDARQPARTAARAEAAGRATGRQARAFGRRRRQPRPRLPPRRPGDALNAGVHLREGLPRAEAGRPGAADHLRAHRHRAGPAGTRRPVLVLLLLQPVQRRARRRLGGDADRLRREHPPQALAKGPSQIALFQHGGGEKADWDDDRVEKEGTHPVVYPAAGSHATFFEPAVYVENGQGGSGLGCDNTTEPLRAACGRPRC